MNAVKKMFKGIQKIVMSFSQTKSADEQWTSKVVRQLRKIWTIAITCFQWGDTGKGKIVDIYSEWADIIFRGRGGANAGHSVLIDGLLYILHLIPCGILRDKDGKINGIGNGVAVDPKRLCDEVAFLRSKGIQCNGLMVAVNAKLTLPTQLIRDRVSEDAAGKAKIGTTGRGIGPTYGDHATRNGLFVNDLLNPDILVAKVRANVAHSVRFLKSFDPDVIRVALNDPDLSSGIFWHPRDMFDVDAIVQKYLEYGKILAPFIRDTDTFMQQSVGKRRILLEGANGTLIDVDHGTYPFTTSTGCTVDSLADGVGLNRSHVDRADGIFKGFYMTRVGEGPFPTELGGQDSADWCGARTSTRKVDEARFAEATVNDLDELRQGGALRRVGGEFGASTGRPRRVGWFDKPLFLYALRWGGKDVIATKLDVLDGCEEIKICTHYIYAGPPYRYGESIIRYGDHLVMAIPIAEVLRHCKPVYEIFPGWKRSIKGITDYNGLPRETRNIFDFVLAGTGARLRIVSTGADRKETIFV